MYYIKEADKPNKLVECLHIVKLENDRILLPITKTSLDEKIVILQDANFESDLLNRPSYLIQGVNLSYARLRFMLDKKLTINHKAFNYLVLDNKNFLKKFGISNDEIRERYPYKK